MPITTYCIDLGELGEHNVEVDYHFQPYQCNRRGHIDDWLPDDEEEFEINGVTLILADGKRVPVGGMEDLFIATLGDPDTSGFYESVTQWDDEP
jgi:hypothetical protein